MDKLKYVGYALIAFGIMDFALSYMGTDIWYEWFGIQLEGFLYTWIAAIFIVAGGLLTRIGGGAAKESE